MTNFLHDMYYLLDNTTWIFLTLITLLGLAFGSFLNLVIYRLPIMLENEWKKEVSIKKQPLSIIKEKSFNLITPPSHCPKCKRKINLWCNIPIISFLLLRGKCLHCKTNISWRYPLIEALTCVASLLVAEQWGVTWQTAALLTLTWALIALVFIDIDHYLLPDVITIPFLWLGLIISLPKLFITSRDAILGAILGYFFLWIAAKIFKIIRGIEGMGHGDFKLLALFGAWCGWMMLPSIILCAALLGVIIGGTFLLWKKYSWQHPIPFGPFIAFSGWVTAVWYPKILHWQTIILGCNY